MTNKPHDAVFKTAFEHPEHAAGLFRSILPVSIRDAIDWSTMALESGSFIDADLGDRHSDLLFSVGIGADRALLYLLLEHQSASDPDMPLRMLVYLVRIWERHRKQSSGALPAIIPVLVSHAPGGWSAPRTFHDLISPHPTTIPEMVQFMPNFTLLVEDLVHLSNEDLRARALAAFPKLALWVLRDGRDTERLYANLAAWARSFVEALKSPRGIEAVHVLMRYIALVNEQISWQEFINEIRAAVPEAEEATMTMAEQLIAQGRVEGRAEGRVEGRVEGRAEVLTKQLALKFGEIPLDYRARLSGATIVELDAWVERVLTATTLEDVFAE